MSEIHGKNSSEKIEIEELCQRVLSVTYFKEIPEPKEGPKELFSYEDENIPKIENVKIDLPVINTQQEDSIKNIMDYIETLQGKIMTQESLNEINNRLNNMKDITQEQKNNIKALLSKMPKAERNNSVPLFTSPINPLPFNYPNYNLGMGMNMPFPQPIQPPIKTHPQISQPSHNSQQSHPYNNYMDQSKRMPNESMNSKMNLSKYKTKPCRNYHSSVGCNRDINCYFIHDTNYKGVDIPNFNFSQYEKKVCPALIPMESDIIKQQTANTDKETDKPNEINIPPVTNQQPTPTPTQVPPYPYVRPPIMPMNLMYMNPMNPYFRPMMINPNHKDVITSQINPMMKIDPQNISSNYQMGLPKNNQ